MEGTEPLAQAQTRPAAARTEADFVAWYGEALPVLLRVLRVQGADRDAAADIAADACAQIYLRWGPSLASPTNYAVKVALHAMVRRARRARLERAILRRSPLPAVEPPPVMDPKVWAAVAQLPFRIRQAVVLRYVADMSQAEIAEAMDVRPGAVAALLHKGRARLRELLSHPQEGNDDGT
jgi:DNA-directed RNA polymerase specialized sigma24 family protein